jgi:HTH-type transcriptional regulator/antitoxin HigA
MYKVIKTAAEYAQALKEAETLIELDPESGTEDGDRLELLTLLISNYEESHFPLPLPDPIEAIKFRMKQQGLAPKDLIPYIGSRSKVSEVLNGKRPLSLKMLRALQRGLRIPAEVLLQESTPIFQNKKYTRSLKVA